MNKSIIRKIALNLAVFQILSCGLAKSESKLVLIKDSKKNPIYQRYDTNTKEYTDISIFDDSNIPLHQYGASQNAFETHFQTLINDPLILNEMQTIFPWKSLDNKEYALLFYKFYFRTLSDDGCGYVAATNYVFRLFEGRETEFYRTFGFPMYEVDMQFIDFNYEIFMLKFFNYYIKSTDAVETIKNATLRKVYEYKLEEYTNKKKEHRKSFNEFKNWTPEEYHEWKELNDLNKTKINELKEKLKKIPINDRKYGVPFDETFGNLDKFLAQYGIKINGNIKNGSKKAKVDEIIKTEEYILFDGKEDYDYSETGPHYLYITDKTKDGKIVVSSWGDKYIFKDKNPSTTNTIGFKTKIKK